MAKKDGDLFDRILVNVLVGMAGTIVGAIVTHEEDPVKELQSQQTSGVWRVNIRPLECPSCQTINEALAKNCIKCGQKIAIRKTPVHKDSLGSFIERHLVVITIIFFSLISLFLVLLVMASVYALAG
jgi:hypothetical protein